jgi:hypothetical protein
MIYKMIVASKSKEVHLPAQHHRAAHHLSSGLLSHFTPHTAASYLPAPLPLIVPSPLVLPLLSLSSGWLSRCLSSRRHLPSDKDNSIGNDATSYAFAPAGDSCCC